MCAKFQDAEKSRPKKTKKTSKKKTTKNQDTVDKTPKK